MARFYLHLRDGVDEVLDPDGVDLSVDKVPAAALLAARDCIAGDVRSGRIDMRYWIDVHDERDSVVHSLRFSDAVAVVPA